MTDDTSEKSANLRPSVALQNAGSGSSAVVEGTNTNFPKPCYIGLFDAACQLIGPETIDQRNHRQMKARDQYLCERRELFVVADRAVRSTGASEGWELKNDEALLLLPEVTNLQLLVLRRQDDEDNEETSFQAAVHRIIRFAAAGEVDLRGRRGAGSLEKIPTIDLTELEPFYNDEKLISKATGQSWRDIKVERKTFDACRSTIMMEATNVTSSSENAAIRHVTTLLLANPKITKSVCKESLKEAGIHFNAEGFQHRIWPESRKRARLDQRAPPGRPKKT